MKKFIIGSILLLLLHSLNVHANDLEYVELPYYKLNQDDLNQTEIGEFVQRSLPGATDVWYDDEGSGLVVAGYVYLDRELVESCSEEGFIAGLRDAGDEYVRLFERDIPGVVTTYEIKRDWPILELVVRSRIPEGEKYRINYRNLFYYNPEYRVDIVSGFFEDERDVVLPVIEEGLRSFREGVKREYSGGIKFKGR